MLIKKFGNLIEFWKFLTETYYLQFANQKDEYTKWRRINTVSKQVFAFLFTIPPNKTGYTLPAYFQVAVLRN